MAALKELSAEEKGRPYAKYYYQEPAAPIPELSSALKYSTPMDPFKALPLERLNDLLDPGCQEVETGYCTLPDGSGYVAVLNPMPGVTSDMVRWWFSWHLLEDLRYKIWFPRDHYATWVPDDVAQMLSDPAVPLDKKKWEVFPYNIVTEDIGAGTAKIHIRFMKPEDMGFDMGRYHAPNVATTVCANVEIKPEYAPADAPGIPLTMVHFIREIDSGVEFRIRFWQGYHVVDKEPVLMLPRGSAMPVEAAAGLFEHCIREYSNLRAILPGIYCEQGGLIP